MLRCFRSNCYGHVHTDHSNHLVRVYRSLQPFLSAVNPFGAEIKTSYIYIYIYGLKKTFLFLFYLSTTVKFIPLRTAPLWRRNTRIFFTHNPGVCTSRYVLQQWRNTKENSNPAREGCVSAHQKPERAENHAAARFGHVVSHPS